MISPTGIIYRVSENCITVLLLEQIGRNRKLIDSVLGDQADGFKGYGVTERGNFEGKNVLELKGGLEERQALVDARRWLFEVYRVR